MQTAAENSTQRPINIKLLGTGLSLRIQKTEIHYLRQSVPIKGIELLLPHDQMIPREAIRLNDQLYIYLYDVEPEAKGPQLLVSRTSPELLKKLLELKILEVSSDVIKVKRVARYPRDLGQI